jgi:hypothetical protein
MQSSTTYHHVAFGVVTRAGATLCLGVGPAVPCADSSGKLRLLLADGKYWHKGPQVRDYQLRSALRRRLRLREGRA